MTQKSRGSQKTIAILMSIVLVAAVALSLILLTQKNSLKQENSKLLADAKTAQTQIATLTGDKTALEDAAKASADQLADVQAQLDAAAADLTARQDELAKAQAAATQLEADLSAAKAAVTQLETDLDTAKADLSAAQATHEGAGKEAADQLAALQAELDAAVADAATRQADLDAAQAASAKLEADLNTANEALKKASDDAAAQAAAKTTAEESVTELQAKVTDLTAQLAAVPAQAPAAPATAIVLAQGYRGPVAVALTVDDQGNIATLKIGENADFAETPGLGAKAKDEVFINQFIGKPGPFKAGEGIDAIAGATVTTDAVIAAINAALEILAAK